MPNSKETTKTSTNKVQVIDLTEVPNAKDKGNGTVVNPDYGKGGAYWNCR